MNKVQCVSRKTTNVKRALFNVVPDVLYHRISVSIHSSNSLVLAA
jgi:hypothetical protein